MTTKSTLVGFVRKSKNGRGLRLNVSRDTLKGLEGYTSRNGEEYIPLVVHLEKLMDLISEQRDFVTINHLSEEEQPEASS